MHVEKLPSVEDVVSTLEAGRQRLSEADLVGASRSARSRPRATRCPSGGPAVGERAGGHWSPA